MDIPCRVDLATLLRVRLPNTPEAAMANIHTRPLPPMMDTRSRRPLQAQLQEPRTQHRALINTAATQALVGIRRAAPKELMAATLLQVELVDTEYTRLSLAGQVAMVLTPQALPPAMASILASHPLFTVNMEPPLPRAQHQSQDTPRVLQTSPAIPLPADLEVTKPTHLLQL
jgi:hypothetical protein